MEEVSISLRDFKVSTDSDWTSALMRFNRYGRALTVVGVAIELNLPPVDMPFDGNVAFGALYGFKKFHLKGYGGVLRNTYSGIASGFEGCIVPTTASYLYFGREGDNGNGSYNCAILDALTGASTVRLANPPLVSGFAVGDNVLITGLDTQYYGYPPNAYFFDYREITFVNPTTGDISFSHPLRYDYLNSFPEGRFAVKGGGKPRIFKLDQVWPSDYKTCLQRGDQIKWGDYLIEGIDLKAFPGANPPYVYSAGRSATWLNCAIDGMAETLCGTNLVQGTRIRGFCEPDKLVGHTTYESCVIERDFGFQSSSVENVSIKDCTIRGALSLSAVKHAVVENVTCQTLAHAATPGGYGTPVAHLYRNVKVADPTPTNEGFTVFSGSTALGSGTIEYMGDGLFRAPYLANTFNNLSPTPGCLIALTSVVGVEAIGHGYVTNIYEISPYQYLQTTLQFAATPSWATGVAVGRAPQWSFENCSGTRALESASQAKRLGLKPGEYYKVVVSGASPQVWRTDAPWGRLTQIVANVIQPDASANAITLTITSNSTAAANDALVMALQIDTTVVGKRILTQSGIIGFGGTDFFRYNPSTALTAIPTTRWLVPNRPGGVNTIEAFRSSAGAANGAIVEFEFFTEQGILRKPLRGASASFNTLHVVGSIA